MGYFTLNFQFCPRPVLISNFSFFSITDRTFSYIFISLLLLLPLYTSDLFTIYQFVVPSFLRTTSTPFPFWAVFHYFAKDPVLCQSSYMCIPFFSSAYPLTYFVNAARLSDIITFPSAEQCQIQNPP